LTLWLSGRINTQKIYNNPIKEFCRDKTQIENIFPEYTFHSEICDSYTELVSKSQNIPSEIKVYKPCFWSQAKGIIISKDIPKERDLEWEYPYLIQEFVDTSNGFEWYSGIHDFRVIILNGKITGSFLRVAPEWVMTANVATGAEIIDFHWKVPEYIQKVIRYLQVKKWKGKNIWTQCESYAFNSLYHRVTRSAYNQKYLETLINISKINIYN